MASHALAMLPLMILLLLPVGWSPNEESYLVQGYQRVVPESWSTYSAIIDRSIARFVYDYISGGLAALLGLDGAQIALRLLTAGFYAIAFGTLFSGLRISVLRALATVVLFDFFGETIFGDDWFFRSAESKTFAYAAVFCGLGLGLRSRWLLATVFLAMGAYLHFLVGGFWFVALVLLALLGKASFRDIRHVVALFLVLITPLFIPIVIEQFGQHLTLVPGTPHPNVIYALRHVHHVAPFSGGWVTWAWARGAIGALVLIILMTIVMRSAPDRTLPRFALLLLAYFFVASIIAYFDRHTHLLAKFYLFRPTTLTLCLTIAIALGTADYWLHKSWQPLLAPTLAAVVCLGFVVQAGLKWREFIIFQPFLEQAELISAIERESAPDEVLLIEPVNEKRQPYVGLHRIIPRPTFVSYKFSPTKPEDILRWQNRLNYRAAIFDHGCRDPIIYPIRLLLAFGPATIERLANCGQVVWRSDEMALLRMDNSLLSRRHTPDKVLRTE